MAKSSKTGITFHIRWRISDNIGHNTVNFDEDRIIGKIIGDQILHLGQSIASYDIKTF